MGVLRREHASGRELGPLWRKASVDAGFDLEPERDGEWWHLRSSGGWGSAWVRLPPQSGVGALLAVSLKEQLNAIAAAACTPVPDTSPLSLPQGAAGALSCSGPEALHAALGRLRAHRASYSARLIERWEADIRSLLTPASADAAAPTSSIPTEVLAHIRRRVGQDLYRTALLDFWDGRCAVTGVAVPELLRASHAKPWAVATDAERLDVYNGLLLVAHFDALFDRGYLTFDDAGVGRLSPTLPQDAREGLGLANQIIQLRRVHARHLPYLAFHRANVFRG